MVWNDQISPAQQNAPPTMSVQRPVQGAGFIGGQPQIVPQPPVAAVPQPGPGMPPLVASEQPQVVPAPARAQPPAQSQPPAQPPAQAPAAMPAQPAAASDKADADDIVWVNRAKSVIAQTQGDPRRQVQALQHVRAQYLKERFGRDVQTDEE